MQNIYQKIFNIKNKNILLTGANGFLGLYFSKLLIDCGTNLYLVDKEISNLKKNLINKSKGKLIIQKSNIKKKRDCKKIVEDSIKKLGHIDIFINCAAKNDSLSSRNIPFEKYNENEWKNTMEINLNSAFYFSQFLCKHFEKNKKEKIIFIGSHYSVVAPDQSLYTDSKGKQSFIKGPDYGVSKFGLLGLTKYLASYYGEKNINVNLLSPTSIMNNENSDFKKKFSMKTPIRRMSYLEEYAGPLLFLCSNSSSYVNGFNLLIDGGLTST